MSVPICGRMLLVGSMHFFLGPPARFNAGTGLGGAGGKPPVLSAIDRPGVKRQDTAPPGLASLELDNLSSAARAAADHVNGSHVAAIQSASPGASRSPLPSLGGSTSSSSTLVSNVPQASRAAPVPPPISTTRQAPAVPGSAGVPKDVAAPSPDVLRARTKAQGPPSNSQSAFSVPAREDSLLQKERIQEQQRQAEQQRKEKEDQARKEEALRKEREEQRREEIARVRDEERRAQQQQRLQEREKEREREQERQLREREKEDRPGLQSNKSAPAVQPLQPTKKVQIQAQDKPKPPAATGGGGGGVAAAEAALTKPKEKRVSTMTEVQIMEKLRSVVSDDDPKTLYSKIKKVGQG